MSQIETVLYPPPLRDSSIPRTLQYWLFALQNLLPLIEVDTSAGNIVQAPPSAGLNPTTGQSNQNVEITYVKTSADANTFQLTGVQFVTPALAAQGDHFKIKSNGTVWYKTG